MKTNFAINSSNIYAVTKDGEVIAELCNLNYRISRTPAAVYTLGRHEPASFAPGKEGITGSFMFAKIYDEAEDVVQFDIKVTATMDDNMKGCMLIKDIKCIYENSDDVDRDLHTFIASSITPWIME
ncbi:MAG: hypothetical protein PHY47_00125 [Lachnospiraceae bacterium]|nr:hypothetical protein [Lachnospiraceae bacterium]